MFIQKFGVKYAVLDRNNTEVCRFDRLADACIVQRYLSNQKLPKAEEAKALKLIRMFDGGGKDDNGKTAGISAELEKAKQG